MDPGRPCTGWRVQFPPAARDYSQHRSGRERSHPDSVHRVVGEIEAEALASHSFRMVKGPSPARHSVRAQALNLVEVPSDVAQSTDSHPAVQPSR